MSKAATAYEDFKSQNEESSLEFYLAVQGIFSETNFDDLSSTWTFKDGSSIKALEDDLTINKGSDK